MRIHTPVEVGLLVRETRRARRWSQDELAETVGATRQWVRRLESGQPRLELGLTLRALTALGIVIDLIPPPPNPPLAEPDRDGDGRSR